MKTKGKHFKNKSSKSEMMEIKKEKFDDELKKLQERIKSETPPSGYVYKFNPNDKLETDPAKKPKIFFKDLALSSKTIRGLQEGKFTKMTPVQRSVIPHALAERDVIGASKTGSGKTLCYIIPVLEILYRARWSKLDGLGALIVVPTRELALQVFEVLKQIGKYHEFSGGLVIGGHDVNAEKGSIYKMNILIGTPGRLLQHFSETAYFNCDNLKILVIDEADRILDEGFQDTLDEIFSYLPLHKNVMLFSATITKSLKNLVKVNLKEPEYITIHNIDSLLTKENVPNELALANNTNSAANDITPVNLLQYYSVIQTHEKVDTLYSFLNSHLNTKCIVFLSSTKQVRFFYEVFRKLKLKFNFFELYGRQKQEKRTYIFYNFLQKTNSVLFATDVASRGVDFPSVDWVIQLDCPEDMATYIHRVGRTARYKSKGNSLLFVSEPEAKLVNDLTNKGVVIKKIKVNPSKIVTLKPILRSILSENPAILHLAKKAISSYLKSVHLNSNKQYFDINNINLEELSLSYGLMMTPELKLVKKSDNDLKNAMHLPKDGENGGKKMSKLQKLKEKIKQKKLEKTLALNSQSITKELPDESDEGTESEKEFDGDREEDEFLKLKRKQVQDIEEQVEKEEEPKEYDFKHKNMAKANTKIQSNYVEKVREKLERNMGESKLLQKQRLLEKRKNDKLRAKAWDYEKHNFNPELKEGDDIIPQLEDPSESNENQVEGERPKLNSKEIENSSLENKSNLALRLIREKGLLK